MAGGMFGANTEVLRQIAGQFRTEGGDTRDAGTTSNSEVQDVEWIGPDADRFREDYESVVLAGIQALAEALEGLDTDLIKHADDQDRTSEVGGGQGGGFDLLGWFKGALQHAFNFIWSDLRSPLRLARFLMEAGYALRNPSVLGNFFKVSWEGITGWRNGVGKIAGAGIEAALENSKLGGIYGPLKKATDFLNLKWASVPFEQGLGKALSAIPGVTPEGVASKINDFFGKEGRLLGRGLGGIGVGLDTFSAYQHFSNGEMGAGAYSTVKAGLGVASFIPGPIGWTAAGISLGLAAYDNIPVVHNAVNWVGGKIADGFSAINPFD